MKIPKVPEHIYDDALLKFSDKDAKFSQWLSAAALILMRQYEDQPEGLTIDVSGCKMRLTLEGIEP